MDDDTKRDGQLTSELLQRFFVTLRARLYEAGPAWVPGLARFAEISPPQKTPQHCL